MGMLWGALVDLQLLKRIPVQPRTHRRGCVREKHINCFSASLPMYVVKLVVGARCSRHILCEKHSQHG